MHITQKASGHYGRYLEVDALKNIINVVGGTYCTAGQIRVILKPYLPPDVFISFGACDNIRRRLTKHYLEKSDVARMARHDRILLLDSKPFDANEEVLDLSSDLSSKAIHEYFREAMRDGDSG
mmetsp:Transcript_19634/g.48931  ORF Transcript_19634/g.48931 Transcript_19634/m.48931 type:complete len:123 (+) Transcript_19634:740-1108(+)